MNLLKKVEDDDDEEKESFLKSKILL